MAEGRSTGVQQGLKVHEVYTGLQGQTRVALVDDTGRVFHCDLEEGAVSPEPREGEQEMTPERRERLLRELAERSVDPDGGLDRDLLTGPPPDHTIASVLRLTASRLRDPEHRWSVDPAVTLEHLAERLEGTE